MSSKVIVMRIGYTIWKANDLPDLPKILETVDPYVNYYVIVIPFTITRKNILKLRGGTFIRFPLQITKVAPALIDTKKPAWIKIQLHPYQPDLPNDLVPSWWPGYVFSDPGSTGAILKVLAQSIIESMEAAGLAIEGCVFATELAHMTAHRRFVGHMRRFIKWLEDHDKDYIQVTYGSNFWQPLRWRYRWMINFCYHWGFGPAIVKAIMKGTPYERANPKTLADIAYNSFDEYADMVWQLGNYTGLSAYFYPSMNSPDTIESAYKSYRFGLFWSFRYAEVAKQWAEYWGKPLMVTETGVLYNSPIAQLSSPVREEAINEWYYITLKEFDRYGCVNFTIWEDHESLLCVDGLARYAKEKSQTT